VDVETEDEEVTFEEDGWLSRESLGVEEEGCYGVMVFINEAMQTQ
jgi:hypothetical protein